MNDFNSFLDKTIKKNKKRKIKTFSMCLEDNKIQAFFEVIRFSDSYSLVLCEYDNGKVLPLAFFHNYSSKKNKFEIVLFSDKAIKCSILCDLGILHFRCFFHFIGDCFYTYIVNRRKIKPYIYDYFILPDLFSFAKVSCSRYDTAYYSNFCGNDLQTSKAFLALRRFKTVVHCDEQRP